MYTDPLSPPFLLLQKISRIQLEAAPSPGCLYRSSQVRPTRCIMRTKAAICSVPLAAAAGKRRAHADTHARANQGPPSTQRQRAPFKGTWSVRTDTEARLDAVDSFSFSLFLGKKCYWRKPAVHNARMGTCGTI